MAKLFFVAALLLSVCCVAQDSTKYLAEYKQLTAKIEQEKNQQALETLYISRGNVLLQWKKFDKAWTDFFYAIQYGRNGSVLRVVGDKEHEALVGRGQAQFHLRKYEEAKQDFSDALRLSPRYYPALWLRGITWTKLNKSKEAIEDFTSAIRIDSTIALGYEGRAAAWHHLQQYDAALRDLSIALSIDSGDANLYSAKGDAYYRKKMFDSAALYHSKATRKAKTSTQSLMNALLHDNDIRYARTSGKLEDLKRLYAAGNYTEAYRICNEIIVLDSLSREAHYYRGLLHAQQNRYAAALADHNKLRKLEYIVIAPIYPIFSEVADFHNFMGNCYARTGAQDSAISSYTTAIRLDSGNAVYYNNRGLSCYYAYRTDSAYRDFQQALKLDPNTPHAHHNLALCYSDRLQYDSAIIELEKNDKVQTVSPISLMNKLFAYHTLQRSGLDLSKITFSPNGQNSLLAGTSVRSMNLPEDVESWFEAGNIQQNVFLTWQLLYLLQQEQYGQAMVIHKQLKGKTGLDFKGSYGPYLTKYIEACTQYLPVNKTREALGLLEIAIRSFPRDSAKIMVKNGQGSLLADMMLAAGKASESLGFLQYAMYYYKTAATYNPYGSLIPPRINALAKKIEAVTQADKQAPEITFLYAAPRQVNGTHTIDIAGYTKDPSGIAAVYVDGKPIRSFSPEWGWFVFTINEPVTQVALEVVDKNKNKATVILTPDAIQKFADGNRKDRYHAILIACDNYKPSTGFKPLQYCTDEAVQLSTILMYHYGFSERDMITLPSPSRAEILRQLRLKLSQMTANDNLLIFFSGHGTMKDDRQPVTYWVPPDAKRPEDYISPADLAGMLDSSLSKHVLIISDACYSGAMQKTLPNNSKNKQIGSVSREIITGSGYSESPERSELVQHIIATLNKNNSPLLDSQSFFQQLEEAMKHSKTANTAITPMWYSFTGESMIHNGFYFKKIIR